MDFCQLCSRLIEISKESCFPTTNYDHPHIKQILVVLIDLTNGLKECDNRESIPVEVIRVVSSYFTQTLLQLTNQHNQQQVAAPQVELATECARCLRNAAAGCHTSSPLAYLYRSTDLINVMGDFISTWCPILKLMSTDERQQGLVLLRCCVQLLGNLVASGCQLPQHYLHIHRLLLSLDDAKLSSYTCFLVHRSLLDDPDSLVVTPGGIELSCDIVKYLASDESEWGLYVIEMLLKQPQFVQRCWSTLDTESKNLLLDIALTQIEKSHGPISTEEDSPDKPCLVTVDSVDFICEEFKEKAYTILGLHRDDSLGEQESVLVVKELSVLCAASALHDVYPGLLHDENLIQSALNLLQCMKMLGGEGDGVFSPVSKITDIQTTDVTHPVCGLKRDVIRLVANMAYKNTANQDKVRELGGIQLILDHTNIDGRNPYITQWSVFAIRNLLDGNPANQAVVAGMRLEGLSDNVSELREYGVDAVLEGSTVVIRNVEDSVVFPFSQLSTQDHNDGNTER